MSPPVPAAPVAPYHGTLVRTVPFFAAALVIALTFGAALGALVLASRHLPWPGLSTAALEAARLVHGHAQVFGFATLFVMGVAYAWLRIKSNSTTSPFLAHSAYNAIIFAATALLA